MSKKHSRFLGKLDYLQHLVASINLKGTWITKGNHHKFTHKYGGELSWWSTTKKIKLMGKWPTRDEKNLRATIDFETKYAFTPSYAPQDDTPINIENQTDNFLDYL